jgi:hypothetical protein
VAKLIEFYVRDLFPRSTRRTGSRLGRVIEFSARFKPLPSMWLSEILSIEAWRSTQEKPNPGTTMKTTKENRV